MSCFLEDFLINVTYERICENPGCVVYYYLIKEEVFMHSSGLMRYPKSEGPPPLKQIESLMEQGLIDLEWGNADRGQSMFSIKAYPISPRDLIQNKI
jgi:hypothetical protein